MNGSACVSRADGGLGFGLLSWWGCYRLWRSAGAGGAENERGGGGPRAVLHLRVDRGAAAGRPAESPGQHPEADEEHFHEDAWGVLRNEGYRNQFEGGWQILHQDVPVVDGP